MKVKDLRIKEAKHIYRGRFIFYFTLTQLFGVIALILFFMNKGMIYEVISYFLMGFFVAFAFMMILNILLSKENKDKYIIYKNDKEKSKLLDKREVCKLFKIKEESFPKLLEKLRK
jgi:hypothetical protein